MKLFNVMLMADCYVVAETPEEARDLALKTTLEEGKFNEMIALEMKKFDNLRPQTRERKGAMILADSVSDTLFDQLKGKTLAEAVVVLNPPVKK